MTLPDFFYNLQWWIIWLAAGIVFLPLTSLIFSSAWDKGYIFAKIIGLLFISYTIWILGSLQLVTFNTTPLFLIFGIFLVFNTYISYQHKTFGNLKKFMLPVIIEEILFTAGLLFWSYVRAHDPSVHGLEKYMDFGFINSILKSEYFPPKDLWLTPLSINYYYFGHLMTAVLMKLSGINPAISYNLMLASLFGFTLAGSFSLGANFYQFFIRNHPVSKFHLLRFTLIAGFLSAFLVTLGGNLHTIYAFFQTYTPPENPVPFWQLAFQWNTSNYWYPNATRFIPNTIHEFPIYSFVVADLHGHVLNIPVVLLMIAFITKVFHQSKILILDLVFIGFLIAVSIMTNVLDGPIYVFIFLIIIITMQREYFKNISFTKFFINTAKPMLIIFISALVFSLPFWIAFKPFASGIGVLCAPDFLVNKGRIGPLLFEANHCARSPLWMMAILWGFFYSVLFYFLYFIKRELRKQETTRLNTTDILVITFGIAATFLLVIPEFLYVKDIYPAHYRANTLFKFGYQAFIILGLTSGYMITRLIVMSKKVSRFSLYTFPLFILFFLVAIYPFYAINSYYGDLKTYKGLDGFKYFQELYPSDYQAILWLQENIEGQPVILEAQGDSYTDFARVSANTGLPTVIGWSVHEWLWRGTYDEAGKRSSEVTVLYESKDTELTKQLIQKYNISYVFIGSLERQKYTKLEENKFYNLGKIVFQNGTTRIYQLYK